MKFCTWQDEIVEPKESSHFEFYYPGSETEIQPLIQSAIYLEDRIGLRKMDEEGKLVFLVQPGAHVAYDTEWLIANIIIPYFNV